MCVLFVVFLWFLCIFDCYALCSCLFAPVPVDCLNFCDVSACFLSVNFMGECYCIALVFEMSACVDSAFEILVLL